VPRPPKNFRVDWVSIDELSPRTYLSTGPDTAVPTLFRAYFQLSDPPAAVTIEVFVGADLGPVIVELKIRSNAKTPVTTSVLRQVLVDQLLREAMEAAVVPSSVRDEWLATLPPQAQPHIRAGAAAPPPAWAEQGAHSQADQDARTAAQIYSEAVAGGSKAPAVAVADAMRRSRPQVARYIRRARELGLLPPLGSPEGA
jgi:hypothetical protein